jgi:hypothetical protein
MFNFSGFGDLARRKAKGRKSKSKGRKAAFSTRGATRLKHCKEVVFKRKAKGGKVLPKSQWVTVLRCEGKKLKATNRRQCRRGGTGAQKHLFVKCPSGKSSGYVRPVRRAA